MSRLEKRLIAAALVFVVIYLGAAALTIHNRMTADRGQEARLESAEPLREERHLMMAELLLPMLILFTVAFSYLLLKKKREKVAARMDEDKDLAFDGEWRQADTQEGERPGAHSSVNH